MVPQRYAPRLLVSVAVLAGVILLSVGASLIALRRVVVTPLGVVRGTRRPIRAAWRWLMLATGLAGLMIVMLSGRAIISNDRIALPIVVTSYALTAFGAAASAPLAGSAIASLLARVWHGSGVLLGARRLKADPRIAGRTVAGVVVVVIAATITSLYVGVYEAAAGDSYFPSSLLPSTVIVEPLSPQSIPYDGLDKVEGVQAVAPAWIGYTRNGYNVLVTDCIRLDLVVEETLPSMSRRRRVRQRDALRRQPPSPAYEDPPGPSAQASSDGVFDKGATSRLRARRPFPPRHPRLHDIHES